ncbi:MAG TPA: metalloregulator ArsR/SmtB family transcription factor [Desulfotignum sp.]|nr:metalloregulator ArsR/SmtB family transcription factor [Desulfotignum sp.]
MQIIKQFKALSDPTRLRLLHILNEVELSVNEIVSIVDMIQSGVSRHLKILLESGLLVSRKEGSFMYYCASRHSETRALITLACSRIQDAPLFQLDLEKARQIITIRKNRTKRFFSTVAPQWEGLKKEVLGNFNLNAVLKQQVLGRSSIADLGCGTGELLGQLVEDTSQKLIGVDASPEMLEQARIKLPDDRSIELRLGEVEYLPMKDQEVDTVVMSMVLYHIFQPEKAIHEVFRVLRPGGMFLLADFKHHDQEDIKNIIGGTWLGFKKKQVEEWLIQSGFGIASMDAYAVERGLSIHLFTARKQ